MLVAVYGVPRSGKTFLCNEVEKKLNASKVKCIHLKPSKMTDDISALYTFLTPTYPQEQRKRIVDSISEQLRAAERKHPIVILDCHYAYPDKTGTPIPVYDTYFHEIYDEYCYMDTDPALIWQRMQQTNGIKDNYDYTINTLNEWKKAEIAGLHEILSCMGKSLHCLTGTEPQRQILDILQGGLI
jgi:hypothetical protein